MPSPLNFIQSSPPFTTQSSGSILVYSFGLVTSLRIYNVSVSLPIQIPSGYYTAGLMRIRAVLRCAGVYENFTLEVYNGGNGQTTDGWLDFSASIHGGASFPAGSLVLWVFADSFIAGPPTDKPAVLTYEGMVP